MKSLLSFLRSSRRKTGLIWSDPNSRRPDDGPPDLEEIWQRLIKGLRGLLPGRVPMNGGAPLRGLGGVIAAVIAVLLFALWLFTGVYTVPEGYAGVVSQFGAYRTTTGAGLWYHLPAPFQSVELVSLSAHSVDIGRNSPLHATNFKDQSMLTADENIVDIRFSVQYHVQDAAQIALNNFHPAAGSSAEDVVTQAGESAVRQIVGNESLDAVFSQGPGHIESELQKSIQAILDGYQSGLAVTGVTIHQVQPPEQVQAAFDDASKALQDRERQKSEGQAYANDVIPRAHGDAARILANAEAYSAEVVANAQGDADRFKKVLAEYTKAPAVTRQRMYLQTMQDILSNTSKVLIDGKAAAVTLNLPTEHVAPRDPRSEAPTATPAAPSPSSPANAAALPAAPAFPSIVDGDRSRDAARAREREQR
jgi:membrane protease subunit HflK